MNNKQIAISWAKSKVENSGIIISDKFFEPFGGGLRRAITRELEDDGIAVWKMEGADGAILFKSNDKRLTVASDKNVKVGLWQDEEKELVIMLPPIGIN